METVRVGIIGCGKIVPAYFKGLSLFPFIEIVAVADLHRETAEARAREFGVPRVLEVDELLADVEIDAVVNLTIPAAHAPINYRALEAGKHTYCEKPLGLHLGEARPVLKLAQEKGLRLGCAPDTFLGGGLQSAKSVLDKGTIGTPFGAVLHMGCPGHETWHPSPAFYYQPGGGPLFDMGPYYLTALVMLLGPVARVAGARNRGFAERIITSQPLSGTRVPVEVDTHICGLLELESGIPATCVFSFDTQAHRMPLGEIYGTEGTLILPDPNKFNDTVRILRRGGAEEVQPPTHHHEAGRGCGLADMLLAQAAGQPHRASGALALHVLEIMEKMALGKGFERMETPCQAPRPLSETVTTSLEGAY